MTIHRHAKSGPLLMRADATALPLADASVDAIVTDPPYGLEFMGKSWDAPWKGQRGIGGNTAGFAPVVMSDGAERLARPSYHGSPNPSCLNCGGSQRGRVGRAVRRCECDAPRFPNAILPRQRAFEAWCEQWAGEALRVLRPGGHVVAFGAPRTYHRLACAIEDAGFEIRDTLQWLFGSGFPKSLNLGDGRGTALKPAYEPIVLARKPLIGTVAQNVEAHGTGALNIDASRIETGDDLNGGAYSGSLRQRDEYTATDTAPGAAQLSRLNRGVGEYTAPAGRWPANVLLDEEAAALIGIPSRFFYTSKASRSEREAGLEDLEPQRRTDGRQSDIENPRLRTSERRNTHPTVKPVDLMRWLVTLVTPPDGLVLDPFMGSGSTGVAAVELGYRFIGIDREEQYVEIAKRRIRHERPMRMVL